jgi:hypothetical protein
MSPKRVNLENHATSHLLSSDSRHGKCTLRQIAVRSIQLHHRALDRDDPRRIDADLPRPHSSVSSVVASRPHSNPLTSYLPAGTVTDRPPSSLSALRPRCLTVIRRRMPNLVVRFSPVLVVSRRLDHRVELALRVQVETPHFPSCPRSGSRCKFR